MMLILQMTHIPLTQMVNYKTNVRQVNNAA